MKEHIYNMAYWITYGKMPPTYKPVPKGELQKLLKKIAQSQGGSE